MDWAAPGLEHHPRPAGGLLRGAYAGLTRLHLDTRRHRR